MKNSEKKLSISIVNYNGGQFLLKCLESIKEVSNEVDLEVWVIDNASSDDSMQTAQKKLPSFKYIFNDDNLGFGRAHNMMLKEAKTEYVLVLNPDTELLPGTLKYMINFMDAHVEVGVATCKIETSDGSVDWASHRGFPTPWASFLYFVLGNDKLYHLSKNDMKVTHEVDAISGAFFLMRKSTLEKVGLFDEDYFMYAEDIDLCFRIKQAGFKVMYVPEVKVIHYKGVTSGIKKHSQVITTASLESKKRAFESFYKTMAIFYKKHLEKKYPFFINWLVYLGINLRFMMAKRSMSV